MFGEENLFIPAQNTQPEIRNSRKHEPKAASSLSACKLTKGLSPEKLSCQYYAKSLRHSKFQQPPRVLTPQSRLLRGLQEHPCLLLLVSGPLQRELPLTSQQSSAHSVHCIMHFFLSPHSQSFLPCLHCPQNPPVTTTSQVMHEPGEEAAHHTQSHDSPVSAS